MNDLFEPKIPYEPPAVLDIDPVTVNCAVGDGSGNDPGDWGDNEG